MSLDLRRGPWLLTPTSESEQAAGRPDVAAAAAACVLLLNRSAM